MSNILNTLAVSHTPSLGQSITAKDPGKWLYVAEGGSIAIIDSTLPSTFESSRAHKKFPFGDRGVMAIRMVVDPNCNATPSEASYTDTIYVAGGRDGLWAISAGVDPLSGNPATRLDDRQDFDDDTQLSNNRRWCNDVKYITINSIVYLAALFQAKDDNRLRLYRQYEAGSPLPPSLWANVLASRLVDGSETGHDLQSVKEVTLSSHPAIADSNPAIPSTSLWSSGIALGMSVSGSDIYVAMGTNGIVKVSFDNSLNATTTWGPIFGTGTDYAGGTGIPSGASGVWYENLVFSGHDGTTEREELPIFSDVVVDVSGDYLFAALENLGWARFDLSSSWTSSMDITHHEGEPVDDNERPFRFRLREGYKPTFVRALDSKSSLDSSSILAITGGSVTIMKELHTKLPGISYNPRVEWNGFENALNNGEAQTALYQVSSLTAGQYNNTSLHKVGGGDVLIAASGLDSVMNVYTYGKDVSGLDIRHRNTTITSIPMTINTINGTNTIYSHDLYSIRTISDHVKGTHTFGVEPSIVDESVLITGGNDGSLLNDGFLVKGVEDSKEVIKAWDASSTGDEAYLSLGIRTTNFAQWKKCGPPGARGQYAAGERFTSGPTYGYWGIKSYNIPQDSYNNEPFSLGEHAFMYPRSSFGVVSSRPYYGVVSRSVEYDNYLASQGKSPYLFMNATNSAEGLIMVCRDSLLGVLSKPYMAFDSGVSADTFLPQNEDLFTAFETHPEVSGMDRGLAKYKEYWSDFAGQTAPVFLSWMPSVFTVEDSGTDKWIACVPCNSIVNFHDLSAAVLRNNYGDNSADPAISFDASSETPDATLSGNYDRGMALFFDITDPTLLSTGPDEDDVIKSTFPKIILPNNPSAVWEVETVVLGTKTYIVVADEMGSIYSYDASTIFTETGATLNASGTWDASASNFDEQPNNIFSLAIDKVSSTDTSAYVYVGVKRLGVEVLRINSNGSLTHEELIQTWDSPHDIKLYGEHPNRRMLVTDYTGGIREFTTSSV